MRAFKTSTAYLATPIDRRREVGFWGSGNRIKCSDLTRSNTERSMQKKSSRYCCLPFTEPPSDTGCMRLFAACCRKGKIRYPASDHAPGRPACFHLESTSSVGIFARAFSRLDSLKG